MKRTGQYIPTNEDRKPANIISLSMSTTRTATAMSVCSSDCSCDCHIQSLFKTSRLLKKIIECLFLGYSGRLTIHYSCSAFGLVVEQIQNPMQMI